MAANLSNHQCRLNAAMPLVLMTDDRKANWAAAAARLPRGSLVVVRSRDAHRRAALAETLLGIAPLLIAASTLGGLFLWERRAAWMRPLLWWPGIVIAAIVAAISFGTGAALTSTALKFDIAHMSLPGYYLVLLPLLLRFALPVVGFAIAGLVYNAVRFHSPTEFGHTYLDVRQQILIEQYGLASYHFLARNLAVAFTLLPELPGHAPWFQISGHGLAIWVTTPALLYVLWPREKPPIHRALWITVACVAAPSLFSLNSGWVQFGYRFQLDYIVFLIVLVAIGGRRLSKPLIAACIAINLFGAITFDRDWQYYRVGGNAYDVVVAH